MRYAALESARTAVWGGGREGRAAIDALVRRFPDKPLTWIVAAKERAEIEAVAPRTVTVADESQTDLASFEVIVKSPGISPYRQDVQAAIESGTRFTSGTCLWFSENPRARTICITGTKGKSSTSALIAHLLRSIGIRTALAGNIGLPLLALETPTTADWHVIELSSFQTADLDIEPDVAVLTSLVEEHLDWHGSSERYRRDKLRLFRRALHSVLPADLAPDVQTEGTTIRFGQSDGWHVFGSAVCFGDQPVLDLDQLPMRGHHNASNVCAALAALDAAGFDAHSAARHVSTFRPLPHRLQELGRRGGILYVNDSIATTPAAMLAAWQCYRHEPVALILGGFDRGLDWHDAVQALATQPPRAICTQGDNGPRLAHALREAGMTVQECGDIAGAVAAATDALDDSGVVLLSPGAPSFPVFRDYTERGRAFAGAAGFDSALIGNIEGLGVH